MPRVHRLRGRGGIMSEKDYAELKAENERLQEEISNIHHDCNRKGCRYYDDDSYKVFYECKAKKALYLNANSVTTKYANILKTLQEIKKIAEEHINTRMLLSDKKSFLEFNNIYKLITKAESEG